MPEDPPRAQPVTLSFAEVSATDLPRVGGKGANLGALTQAGVPVPPGFCVTTHAFDLFIAALPDAGARFDALDALDGRSPEAARAAAESMRQALDTLAMPAQVARAVVSAWHGLGVAQPVAVRSSATAEDLPGASFAGQQDTYLNILGEVPLLDAVRRCWISLFTDRAVLYRARGGFGHRGVRLGVVVQQMVDPEVSGILFTADPVSGHRHVTSIDAGFGLGEALVSGLISADLYRIDRRSGEILLAQAGDKQLAIRAVAGGGTRRETLPESQRKARALSDEQVRALEAIGSRVEALYRGEPQDIEWCIAGGRIFVVQARPITSLYPIPRSPNPEPGLRVFLSFGHLQMMLDAMPRLALQVWQLFFPAGKTRPPGGRAARASVAPGTPPLSAVICPAGGRLYVDATGLLRVPRARGVALAILTQAYEALAQSVAALVNRAEFRQTRASTLALVRTALGIIGPVVARVPAVLFSRDPVAGAAAFGRAVGSIPLAAGARIRAAPTPADRIRQSARELDGLFGRVRSHLSRVVAGFIAHKWLARLARHRAFDEVRADVDRLLRGLPGNVTTEMDLAVGDLTDLVRPHPELAALLESRPWAEARTLLDGVSGGRAFAAALDQFLARYGNRGASEIDVSRPRWRDDPSLLLRVITGGLFAAEAGAHRRRHQAQVDEGESAAARLIAAAGHRWPQAFWRWWVGRLTRVARAGMGLREHPKLIIVQILGVVRAEVLRAGEALARQGQIAQASGVWHLGFDEVARALDDSTLQLSDLVAERAAELRRDQPRKPPIAMSSDGEIPAPAAERSDLPAGALAGTGASRGVVEGIARVVSDPEREVLQAGEILVTRFTDPGWTPLFVHAAGLVTEVGGMMTHGAVVAREYGIPAVVSVTSAVERIKTGQRIRVDGTRGFVEILDPPD
ncbi:MAG TPA: phosphoenolpyruvate synthase [Polyangia bacterium]|nr:phosphoenolpyruvate synthase [Polyangia bacterium]